MQQVKGVQPLRKGINPATWMLEVSTLNREHQLGVDFAEIYRRSDLHKCAPFLDLLMATLKRCVAWGMNLQLVCCVRCLLCSSKWASRSQGLICLALRQLTGAVWRQDSCSDCRFCSFVAQAATITYLLWSARHSEVGACHLAGSHSFHLVTAGRTRS